MSDETMSMLDDRIAELEDENAALQRENAALRADLLIEEERSIYWRDNEAALRKEREEMRKINEDEAAIAANTIKFLKAENAALRKDKERMDWLVKNHQHFMSQHTTNDPKMFRSYVDTCISMWDKFERKG